MLTLFDYLPSRNGWKVRQLLAHLGRAYRTEIIGIFAGEGQAAAYRAINPTGAVPAIRLPDGRVLAESNAILGYLAEGSAYCPDDAYARARVQQWLSFEQQYVEPTIGSLRYWTLTGKLPSRVAALVESRRAAGERALRILDRELATRDFVAGDAYGIADISVFAYASLADDAGLALQPHAHLRAWMQRVQAQPGHLSAVHPYSADPDSVRELP